MFCGSLESQLAKTIISCKLVKQLELSQWKINQLKSSYCVLIWIINQGGEIILLTTTYQLVACLQSPSLYILCLCISLKISPMLKWDPEPLRCILFSKALYPISASRGQVPQAAGGSSHTDAQAWARHLRRRWCSLFWWVTSTKTKTECFSRSQKGNRYLFSSTFEFAFCQTYIEFQTSSTYNQERQTSNSYLLIMIIWVQGILSNGVNKMPLI